jgi:hypothetical protein
VANPIEERLAEILLDTISDDIQPSSTHMDIFESFAPPHLMVQYALVLMQRIANDQHPSIPMLRRAQRVAASLGS